MLDLPNGLQVGGHRDLLVHGIDVHAQQLAELGDGHADLLLQGILLVGQQPGPHVAGEVANEVLGGVLAHHVLNEVNRLVQCVRGQRLHVKSKSIESKDTGN